MSAHSSEFINRPTDHFLGHAVKHCEEIGNSYHRTDREARVSKVVQILEELGRVLLDPRTAGDTPSSQVSQAHPDPGVLKGFMLAIFRMFAAPKKAFLGGGFLFGCFRTMANLEEKVQVHVFPIHPDR